MQNVIIQNYIKPIKPLEPETKFEMKIRVEANHVPFFSKPRRLSCTEKLAVKQIIDDLLEEGVIRKSNSEYSSPIVLIKKKTNDLRMCVDFRELNKITLRDNFPIPLIEDQIDHMCGKKYFTCLDLKSAFHHVDVEPASVKYTSFVTPMGQYEYLKVPFGLRNSSSVFMRYINIIFSELLDANKVMIYIDDILIATETIQENQSICKLVFDLLVRNKLTLRMDKCQFLCTEITHLGYVISDSKIRPNNVHIEAIKNYPLPRNVKELHSFIGLASYFRKFVKDFSLIAKPLYDLLRNNATFEFGEEQLDSFNKIRSVLVSHPVLIIYSPHAETQLHCDASSLGFGGILLQKSDDKFHPVSYFSQRSTAYESKMHSFELEMLAIIHSLKRFRVYLQGIPFKILTDCNSVNLALKKKDIHPKINRWALMLQNYNYTLEHRESSRMRHVDALSRINSILVLEENTFEQNLSIAQNLDPIIRELKLKLQDREDKHFELQNGLIYRKVKDTGGILFYVPRNMESEVIRNCHDNVGHIGDEKTYEYLRRIYWFPEIKSKIKLYIRNCIKCLTYSPGSGKTEGTLHCIPKGDKPFIILHIDHYGPLEKTNRGKRYVFEVIDGFTKFVKLYSVKTTGSSEVIQKLDQYFNYYSKPVQIISDRGSAYTSRDFESFMKENDIIHTKVATASPRSNGQIERVNRDITPMLSKLTEVKSDWDKYLFYVEFAINNTFSKATTFSPSMLLFGINQRDRDDNLRN